MLKLVLNYTWIYQIIDRLIWIWGDFLLSVLKKTQWNFADWENNKRKLKIHIQKPSINCDICSLKTDRKELIFKEKRTIIFLTRSSNENTYYYHVLKKGFTKYFLQTHCFQKSLAGTQHDCQKPWSLTQSQVRIVKIW